MLRCLSFCLALLFSGFFSPLVSQIPPVVPGFPNVQQTPGAILSGLNEPNQGRTAMIAYHNGVLVIVPEHPASQPGSDLMARTWDISDPTSPVVTGELGTNGGGIMAHGYFKSGDYLTMGVNWPPEAPWSFRRNGIGTLERTTFPNLLCSGSRGCLYQPWFIDSFWSYGEVSGNATLRYDNQVQSSWDHLGQTGVIGHPFIVGNLLIYASDQSRTGVATYDISDPTNPVLLDVLKDGGAGGYWPELWGGDGKLYVVFPYRIVGNGIRVVDVTDPTDMSFVADVLLPGDQAMYMQFQDEFGFVGDHKVDMRTLSSVLHFDAANTVRPNDGGTGVSTSQFALPLGNLLVTGGVGEHQGMSIWAHQAEPDTRGPSVGFHIPRDGQTHYPLGLPISLLIHETLETPTIVNGVSFIVRPVGGSPISGKAIFAFNDTLTFSPDQPLMANTTYEVVIPDGGIKDASGNGIEGYSFTFSTGSAVNGNQPPNITAFSANDPRIDPGQSTSLAASASDPDGPTVEYRFDFGDGREKTSWSSSSTSPSHVYSEKGHYRASVQVRDPSGALATRTAVVNVFVPAVAPFPSHSSQVACVADTNEVWAVNPDNDSVSVVSAPSVSLDSEIAVCSDPRSIARSTSTGESWVSCHDDDRLAVLSSSGSVVGTVDTGYGSAPSGVVFSADGETVFVAMEGAGEVRRYSRASRTEQARLPLGPGPRALSLAADGSRLLVTRLISPENHAEVWEIDPASTTLLRTLEVPKIRGRDNHPTTAAGLGTANYLTAVAIAPDGASAWVTANKPHTERGLLFGPDLDSDNTVRNLLIQIALTDGQSAGTVLRTIDLDNSDSASSLAFSPAGDYLLVTLQGNNEVLVLDVLALDVTVGLGALVGRIGVGLAPQGLCSDGSTDRLFVNNFMDRSLTSLEMSELYVDGDVDVTSSSVQKVNSEALPFSVFRGKQVFYNGGDERMGAEGYLSCATCHLDGGHDGRTWDFTGRGEGLRNTTSLRGRSGLGHGNVHWSANFDEIQDFENDIRNNFGGTGFLDNSDFSATEDPLGLPKAGLSTDLDQLAAYVSSLGLGTLPRSPYREANGEMTAAGMAGETLFASQGCGSCHASAALTDSSLGSPTLHDVGTLRSTSGGRLGGTLQGIDTPTLHGLWNTAPYLHDGSAPGLEDVFRVAGGQAYQAEDAVLGPGATISLDQSAILNFDDTVRSRGLMNINDVGETATIVGVDGGSGGVGAIEIRYSAGRDFDLTVRVNGQAYTLPVFDQKNDPAWQQTHWTQARLEGVSLSAGATNDIEFECTTNWPGIAIDEVVVSTANDLAAAQPHRKVLALSGADRENLMQFLFQLDGGDGASELFGDGYETSMTDRWSRSVP